MKTKLIGFILFITLLCSAATIRSQVYMTYTGAATFVSDAPLELITASTQELSGAVNILDNRFAFRIPNKSFVGFNSLLQQEHFYENYIESDKYTYSSFQGKIIEAIDLTDEQPQEVRAKGSLSIHGKEQERIIRATIRVKGDTINIHSVFQVPLEDHDIRIPKVVYQKIAEFIDVEVKVDLILKQEE